MGWQPGSDDKTGDEPGPVPGVPGRDPRLADFAHGGTWDTRPPSAALAATLEKVSGPEQRYHGASRDELLGVLRKWEAQESWSAANKLSVLRALIREDDEPSPGWSKSLTHEVSLALSVPPQSAERLMWNAWNLETRLPGVAALLENGKLTFAKARAINDALGSLSDEDAARAEALILPELPGKTYSQAEKRANQAAITVDPESATRRREEAERNRARVALRRDPSGAVSLSGYDLPTDETLAAHASVCARAQQYKDARDGNDQVFPGVRMDQFRAMAYLDLMNGITADERIASGQPASGLGAPNEYGPATETPEPDGPATDAPAPDGPGTDGPDTGPQPDDGPDNDPPDPGGPDPIPPPASDPRAAAPPPLADLVIPLRTLLGQAERPGEGHALGPLDPNLCRDLAVTAANSPHTTLCLTVTDQDGIAIGHGCLRPPRRGYKNTTKHTLRANLPARVNLTVTAADLRDLTQHPSNTTWTFTPRDDPGPPGGFGTWSLTLPDGGTLVTAIDPVPTWDCDHRHESHAYQPNATLRHLVQVRDYTCTFPTCSRHARECDFEHAQPYDKGGRTCGCNAGARSRQCHQVKQSRGWRVTQPRPGWHWWETPSGRGYLQGPKRYPV
jgi:hypothetical protein